MSSTDQREQLAVALRTVVLAPGFKVPPFPAAASRLKRIASDPRSSIGNVAEVVASDPVLAGAILSAANSAIYAGNEEVVSIPRAVNRLGLKATSSIALASGLGQDSLAKGVLFDAKYLAYRRTLSAAFLARELAALGTLDPEECFVASLLRGVGRQVAITALEMIVTKAKPSRPMEVEDWLKIAERHRIDLAKRIVSKWGLPELFSLSLDEEKAPDHPIGIIGRRADELSKSLEDRESFALLSPEDQSLLQKVAHDLPTSLEVMAPPPEVSVRQPEFIAPEPPSHASGSAPAPSCTVTDLRTKNPAKLTCTGVHDLILSTMSSRPFQVGAIVHLRIDREERTLSVWLSVRSVSNEQQEHMVEFSLFSPSKEQREQWSSFFA